MNDVLDNCNLTMDRNINWDSNTRNKYYAGESGFLTSQIWMNELEDDIQTSGVEIIELNSTDNSRSSNEDSDSRGDTPYASHPWSNARGLEDLEKANRQARLRAHLRNLNSFPENSDREYNNGIEYFNNSGCPTPDTADIETFQQTCFSILDKLSALKLDSSSDFDESSNEARFGDVLLEPDWNGEPSGEMIAYSSDLDGDKQTLWIYSFNKKSHVLSDHDYELVNIPSQDSVSCSSFSAENDELNRTKSHRVSSPIPAMHIPRLDLSLGATLPNVTEVTEPKSLESLKIKKYVPITQKPANNWCLDNSEKVTKSKVSNIVDWMGLSPRDRMESRRISVGIIPLALVPEVSRGEDKPQLDGEPGTVIAVASKSFKQDKPQLNPFGTQDESVISTSNSPVHFQRTSTGSNRKNLQNKTYLITPSAQRREDFEFPHEVDNIAGLNKLDAIRTLFDRGDCKVQTRIENANPFLLSPKSNPIENLSSDSITEQNYCREDRRCLSAGDHSKVGNLSFKSVEWTAYFPVTESRHSIVLPIEPKINAKRTFLRRCFSCFKCCK